MTSRVSECGFVTKGYAPVSDVLSGHAFELLPCALWAGDRPLASCYVLAWACFTSERVCQNGACGRPLAWPGSVCFALAR